MPSRNISQFVVCETKPCVRFSGQPPISYLVRFPDSSYLCSYLDSGLLCTPTREHAKVFRDRTRAKRTAELFGAEVCEVRLEQSLRAPKPTAIEFECARAIVEIGGGQFAGVWPAIPGRSEALVLWNAPTGTTQGCLIGELSAELVRLKCAASVAAFEAFQVHP